MKIMLFYNGNCSRNYIVMEIALEHNENHNRNYNVIQTVTVIIL